MADGRVWDCFWFCFNLDPVGRRWPIPCLTAGGGLVFVRTHDAQCHAIDRVSARPLRIAPPFRELHNLYPVERLEEAFPEGIDRLSKYA